MSPLIYLAAALACGAGAVVRFGLSKMNARWKLPWPTFGANLLGSFTLGVIAHIALTAPHADQLTLIAGGGFAGGLTTFSTLSVDAVVLWRGGRLTYSMSYLAATFVGGLLGAGFGWALVGWL
ncbi:fluoride efflux transporter FluC [Demequina oxidasica]|uniref:fluoride efflux transporter FluC n=1 Tax=Demequina oxidasica TaxID=676199 RepID=UPI000782C830|nr:CrcB family protein [Demequina oxidasica]